MGADRSSTTAQVGAPCCSISHPGSVSRSLQLPLQPVTAHQPPACSGGAQRRPCSPCLTMPQAAADAGGVDGGHPARWNLPASVQSAPAAGVQGADPGADSRGGSFAAHFRRMLRTRKASGMNRLGISVLRFSSLDVDRNFQGVCVEIDRAVQQRIQ